MRVWTFALALADMPAAVNAQSAATPLFASDEPVRLTITGAIDQVPKGGQPGTVAVSGTDVAPYSAASRSACSLKAGKPRPTARP